MKKYLSTAVCVVFSAVMLCICVFADTVAGGTCGAGGDNLTWELDDFGILTISGVGEMQDYTSALNKPWNYIADSIISVVIGNGVTSIGAGAFEGCGNLENVTVGSSVTSIGNNAFKSCGIKSIIIHEGVTVIGGEAFRGCKSLTSVEIPKSVVSIGDRAFFGCSALKNVTIPNGVAQIGNYAFSSCKSLEEVKVYSRDAVFGTSVFSSTNTSFVIYCYEDSEAHKYAVKNKHTFTIFKPALGDASGDGTTNTKDVMVFARYIAGWKEFGEDTVNLSALDLNSDGKVNSIDLIILARHLSNWIGYESLPYTKA